MIFVLLKRYEEQRKQLLTLSENLNFAANHDPLTRLYNRRYLVNQVNEWICKPEKSFWIVLMDVDEFKAVNDTYGHGYGDDVLREAGRLMLEEMMGKRNRSPVRRRGVYAGV
ncbi:MAG: GGDEF domain-containing protein [Waltera sp.]